MKCIWGAPMALNCCLFLLLQTVNPYGASAIYCSAHLQNGQHNYSQLKNTIMHTTAFSGKLTLRLLMLPAKQKEILP
jgi:hypothetical protein